MTELISEESKSERVEAERHHRPSRSELVLVLIDRDGDNCRYCQRDFAKRERTIDHVYPQSRGKADGWTYEQIWHIDNLALSCKPCNAKKSDRLLDENGNIPRHNERTFRYRRDKRAQRAEICTSCNVGRNLGPDEVCAACGSGPLPERFPRWAKLSATDCDHEAFWCAWCSIGVIERKGATAMLMTSYESQEEGLIE